MPFCTSMVASGAAVLSRARLSITVPLQSPPGWLSSGSMSITSRTCSNRSSMRGAHWPTPARRSYRRRTLLIKTGRYRANLADACGIGVGFVDLRSAPRSMGTCAARTWAMASLVCGITPSSAATTSTAMSVTWAPRAARTGRKRRVARAYPGSRPTCPSRSTWTRRCAPRRRRPRHRLRGSRESHRAMSSCRDMTEHDDDGRPNHQVLGFLQP